MKINISGTYVGLPGSLMLILILPSCRKISNAPHVPLPAAITVVNAIPNSLPVVAVVNSGSTVSYFSDAYSIGYGNFLEYSLPAGLDTIYAVQSNSDTSNIGPKASGMMYYAVQQFSAGHIYSLFLCGLDTISPDYLMTIDSIPYYANGDSVMGVRFLNLAAGSNPISVNLQGSPNGSEVEILNYKEFTLFKKYNSNSFSGNYNFIIRDATTGDSLALYTLYNNGNGIVDPNNGSLLTYKNITFAVYGLASDPNFQINAMIVDNY